MAKQLGGTAGEKTGDRIGHYRHQQIGEGEGGYMAEQEELFGGGSSENQAGNGRRA
jgi:hypothetical protein